jgi:POT family proton-dependent oligopeptide transporter
MAASRYASTPPLTTRMPGGIPYIVGNEAAERFSYYGMTALLQMFMTKYLMDSDGKLAVMSDNDATSVVHLFTAAAYFTPIVGAIISDVFLGKYRTIMTLSMFYCLGHLTLAIDSTRVGLTIGLTLIAMGAGGIKPCVSAHVGDQFGRLNQHLLEKVFNWFYLAINLGAFVSTLLTPWILKNYGPHPAFGLPGGLMLLATWVFWLGRWKFVHIPPRGWDAVRETFSGDGLRALFSLGFLYLFLVIYWALHDQTYSTWIVQAEYMNRRFLFIDWLSAQIGAVNPVLVLTLVPLFSMVVYPAVSRYWRLTPLRKISVGLFLMVISYVLPAWIETQITGGRIEQFKSDWPGRAKEFHKTGSVDPELSSARNLLDGKSDGTGWISEKLPTDSTAAANGGRQNPFPVEIAILLRERRAWDISEVRINPYADVSKHLQLSPAERRQPPEAIAAVQACWARQVEVLTGNSPIGPWTSQGRLELQPRNELQSLRFSTTRASYVLLRVHSNGGGPYAAMGEAEVLAAGEPPADAHPQATDVWPNVAATGHRPNIVWQLIAYVLLTASEVLVYVTGLEFSYTQAPQKMKSFIMSLYLLSISAGNLFTSAVNQAIQRDDGTTRLVGANYFLFFAGLMLLVSLAFVFVARYYRERTYIQGEPGAEPAGGKDA